MSEKRTIPDSSTKGSDHESSLEAITNLVIERFLSSKLFGLVKLVVIGGIVISAAIFGYGTLEANSNVKSVRDQAAAAEISIRSAEDSVTAFKEEVEGKSKEFNDKIKKRIDAIIDEARTRLGTAAKDLESFAESEEERLGAIMGQLDEASRDIKKKEAEFELEREKAIGALQLQSIDKQIGELIQETKSQMEEAVKAIENLVGPAEIRLEAGITGVEEKEVTASERMKDAVTKVETERDVAFGKLQVKSIDELDRVRKEIDALSEEGGQLNLKSVRAFVDAQMMAIFLFSVLAVVFSSAALWRSGKKSSHSPTRASE